LESFKEYLIKYFEQLIAIFWLLSFKFFF